MYAEESRDEVHRSGGISEVFAQCRSVWRGRASRHRALAHSGLKPPYWLDEAGTYWATNAGLKEIPAPCAVLPLSILYAGLFLLLRTLFGTAEFVTRVPSLLATAPTYVVFRDVKTRWEPTRQGSPRSYW